jgi:hypothetical protein
MVSVEVADLHVEGCGEAGGGAVEQGEVRSVWRAGLSPGGRVREASSISDAERT